MAGQKLGSSAVLCYIRHDVADPASNFSLTVANVGTCQAILCRSGKPLPLSKVFNLEQCPEEAKRVKEQKAIITEVGLYPLHFSFHPPIKAWYKYMSCAACTILQGRGWHEGVWVTCLLLPALLLFLISYSEWHVPETPIAAWELQVQDAKDGLAEREERK